MDVTCPHCQQALEADNDCLGTTVTCPACNREFIVPKLIPIGPTADILSKRPDGFSSSSSSTDDDRQKLFDITCPHCGNALEADDSLIGELVPCPACGNCISIHKPQKVISIGSRNRISRKGKRIGLWISGILVLMLCMSAIIIVIARSNVFDSITEKSTNKEDGNVSSQVDRGKQTEKEPSFQNMYGVHFIESGPNGPLLLIGCERNQRGPHRPSTYFVFEGSYIHRLYNALPAMKAEFIKFQEETAEESERLCLRSPELTTQSGFVASCVAWYIKDRNDLTPYCWSKPRNPTTNRTFEYASEETKLSIEFWRLEEGKTFSNWLGFSTPFRAGCVMKMGARSGMGSRVFHGKGSYSFNNLPPEYEEIGTSDTIYWFMVRFLVPGDFDKLQQEIQEAVPHKYLTEQ